MKRKWRISRPTAILAALALTLVLSSSLGSALAYFTTYTEVKGSHSVGKLGSETEVTEVVNENVKTVTVKNTGKTACYVRVKAFAGDLFTLDYSGSDTKWKFEKDGGWFYYDDLLEPGDTADPFVVKITWDADAVADDFDVIVTEECIPASYKEDGSSYADWNAVVTKEGVPYDEWNTGKGGAGQ